MTTSTPSISSVRAPLTAASNISCRAGLGVWWTSSRVGISASLAGNKRSLAEIERGRRRVFTARSVATVAVPRPGMSG